MIRGIQKKTLILVILSVGSLLLSGYSQYKNLEDQQVLMRARELSSKNAWEKGIAEYERYLEKSQKAL